MWNPLLSYTNLGVVVVVFPYQAPNGYDPARSKVSDNAMQNFLNGETSLDLLTVPGIGPKAAESLAKENITIVPHLLAKYMSGAVTEEQDTTDGSGVTIDVFSTNQHFWHFLQSAGVHSLRSGIVNAVNRKVASFDNQFTDNTVYDKEEEE